MDEFSKWANENSGKSTLEKTEQARKIWLDAIPPSGLRKAFEQNYDRFSGIAQMESAKATLAEIIKDDDGNEVSWEQDMTNKLNTSEDGLSKKDKNRLKKKKKQWKSSLDEQQGLASGDKVDYSPQDMWQTWLLMNAESSFNYYKDNPETTLRCTKDDQVFLNVLKSVLPVGTDIYNSVPVVNVVRGKYGHQIQVPDGESKNDYFMKVLKESIDTLCDSLQLFGVPAAEYDAKMNKLREGKMPDDKSDAMKNQIVEKEFQRLCVERNELLLKLENEKLEKKVDKAKSQRDAVLKGAAQGAGVDAHFSTEGSQSNTWNSEKAEETVRKVAGVVEKKVEDEHVETQKTAAKMTLEGLKKANVLDKATQKAIIKPAVSGHSSRLPTELQSEKSAQPEGGGGEGGKPAFEVRTLGI